MQLGTPAEWLSALAALGALVAAVWAGMIARRLYGIERARDRARVASERRRDAALVHAWTACWFDDQGVRYDGLVISNTSSNPVFGMVVESVSYDGSQQPKLRLSLVPPGRYFVARSNEKYRWEFPELIEHLEGSLRPIMRNREWRVTRMLFQDVRGVSWIRTERGLRRGGRAQEEVRAAG